MTKEIQLKESMSEKEIVEYLKANKTMGVALAFVPPDVRRWCEKHQNDDIFMIFDSDYKWVNIVCPPINLGPRTIYSIKDDYELKPAFIQHWEEFDINENGYFYYDGKEYYYRDDATIEKRYSHIFKGFGGWLFNDRIWCTVPQIATSFDKNEGNVTDFIFKNESCEPVIPSKIRFWRYRE